MARVHTVLLDAGGVLLDLDYRFVQRLIAARGCHADLETLQESEAHARTSIERRVREGGRTSEAWRDYFRFLLARVGADPGWTEEIIDVLWDAHHRVGLWTVAIDGAVEAVRALREAGYRVGVVSNAEGRVEQDLGAAGFRGLLEAVVDSHVVGVEKPDPRIFAIALERLGAEAASTVFLGDVPAVDVDGALAAGIAPILLDRHDLYPDAPAPRLRAIAELPGFLASR